MHVQFVRVCPTLLIWRGRLHTFLPVCIDSIGDFSKHTCTTRLKWIIVIPSFVFAKMAANYFNSKLALAVFCVLGRAERTSGSPASYDVTKFETTILDKWIEQYAGKYGPSGTIVK